VMHSPGGRHSMPDRTPLLFPQSVIEVRLTRAGDAYATAVRIACEHDEWRRAPYALHLPTVITSILPRNSHRHQSRMRGRSLDSVTVTLREIAELVAHDRLRRSLPGLDWGRVHASHRHCRMKEEMLAEVRGLETRSHQKRGCIQCTSGENHLCCDDCQWPRLAMWVGVKAHDARSFVSRPPKLLCGVRRDDLGARSNCIHEVRDCGALLSADPAPEHAVAALLRIAAKRVARDRVPAIAECFCTTTDRRVVFIDLAFVGRRCDPSPHSVERFAERIGGEEAAAGELRPFFTHVVGSAEAGLPVHRCPAAKSGTGKNRDAQIASSRQLSFTKEPVHSDQLVLVEITVAQTAASLYHYDVQPIRRELRRDDASGSA